MFHRRHAVSRPPPTSWSDVPLVEEQCFAGQLMFVSALTDRLLHADCVLDFGPVGYLPVSFHVELADSVGLAAFEDTLLRSWLAEGRYVAAVLHLSRGQPRLSLSCDDCRLLLPLPVTL